MRLKRFLVAILVMAGMLLPAEIASASTQTPPDLQMGRLSNLWVEKVNGQRLLRFDSTIVNTGSGAFEVRGDRSSTATTMSVTQRVYNSDGTSTQRATGARMYFAGDGHSHWHLRDLSSYELYKSSSRLRTSEKHGFCFWDYQKYWSTARPRTYTGCGYNPSLLTVTTGLSVGWADPYPGTLPDQYINITGLPSGVYRLVARADAQNFFLESNDGNNVTWVDFRIQGNGTSVSITGVGPIAPVR